MSRRLDTALNNRGWSNSKLATATGLKPATIYGWRSGKATPPSIDIERIATVTRIPYNYLVFGQ